MANHLIIIGVVVYITIPVIPSCLLALFSDPYFLFDNIPVGKTNDLKSGPDPMSNKGKQCNYMECRIWKSIQNHGPSQLRKRRQFRGTISDQPTTITSYRVVYFSKRDSRENIIIQYGSTIYMYHEGLGILAQNYHPKTCLIFTF